MNFDKKSNLINNNFQISNNNITVNNNINDFSSIQLIHHDQGKKILPHKDSIFNDKNNNIFNYRRHRNSQIINNHHKGKDINKSANSNLIIEDDKSLNNSNLIQNKDLFHKNIPFNNINIKNDCNSQNIRNTKNILSFQIKAKTQYLKKQLFPYKYYLCSIFIKNTDIKKNCFFTKKFIVVYDFICQLFDISSYLILQREFQTMKNTIIEEKERKIIEKEQKINVNERFFNMNMKECLNGKKLSIFGKTQLQKSAKNMRNKLVI